MKLLTAISLLVLILQATTSDEVEWSNFKIKYGKF